LWGQKEERKMSITLVTDTSYGAKIKVIGVGGAGGNAINNMIDKGLDSVDFIALNTDMQDLERNKADMKIQIGRNTTLGLGAGMDERKAQSSRRIAEEEQTGEAAYVFLTAGMEDRTAVHRCARIAVSFGLLYCNWGF
jgi:cell division protein FtsZ